MISSKIFDRLDLSADFWKHFDVQNKKLKKPVGLFETEKDRKTKCYNVCFES